jgi:RNA polymerase sigma-32 factor
MGATSSKGYKALTAEEERELVRRARSGDRRALDRLISACLPFVGSVAVEYRRWGHPLEDIVQEGCMGLMKAIDRFDPDRGCRLITYACYWIRAEIRAFVVRAYRLVRIGTSKAERRALRHYRKTRERDPRVLAEVSGLSVERAENLLPALSSREASLDDQEGERGVGSLRSSGPSPEEIVSTEVSTARLGAALADAVSALPERERIILEQRYLRDETHTLEELGRTFGISKERVRQLEERAMKRVREAVHPVYVEDHAA